jgi:hypothetical protein
MSTRHALLLGALAVAGAAIGLAVAVNRAPETPAIEHAPPSPSVVAPAAAPNRPDDRKLAPIPPRGFATWTGREGTVPGELEEYATVAGLPLDVALEQRRSTLLVERTVDPDRLAEILGAPPSEEVRAAIEQHTAVLHQATAAIQLDAREGSLSAEDAIRETRAAEEAYRRAYQATTGLSDRQFDRLFER